MPGTLVPHGPKGHWLGGHLPDFRHDRLTFFTRCAREFGDMVALRLAYRRLFLVSHPSLIEEVLVTQGKHFHKHFALRLNPLLLGNGLLTSEGDFWLRQRRLVQPAFLRPRLITYSQLMVDVTCKLLDSWKPGDARDILVEMMRLTLDIAAGTLFSSEATQEAQSVAQALQVLQEDFLQRFNSLLLVPLWLPTPGNLKLKRSVERLDQVVYRFIAQRRQSKEDKGDLLSILLQARAEDDGTHMTDRQVRDEAMTLFLAGHETTGLALSWSWYLLATHPQAQAKLVEEVNRVCGKRMPTMEDVAQLKFTEHVVLEAMRLYPPAYVIGREAVVDCQIGPWHVPRGMTLLMSQWVVQRDPRFFPEPETFRPERWSEDSLRQLPKFAYFPFGGGPRQCIGNTFAMIEMILVLACIAQRFYFTLQPGQAVLPWATFTLRPHPGIPAVIRERTSAV
jgi:cytochrome P450